MDESKFDEDDLDSVEGVIDVEGLEHEVLLQYKEYRSQLGLDKCCGFNMLCIYKYDSHDNAK